MSSTTQDRISDDRLIRLLIVDDSVVARMMVTRALEGEHPIEVVGFARNGRTALAMVSQLKPDVITLDVDMPEMNGLELLRRLPPDSGVKVIMCSSRTERGATATLEALSLGAHDCLSKPSNTKSPDEAVAYLKAELVPRIRQFFRSEEHQQPSIGIPSITSQHIRRAAVGVEPCIVAIGVSTGGPSALAQIIPALPADFALPVLIVQHMPKVFTRLLAERLQASSALSVTEAVNGDIVKPGRVLIAPGDYHMRVRREQQNVVIRLDQEPPQNSCRPAVDALFCSVELVYGAGAIAVVLTGMGYDGLAGATALKSANATVVAQDESSSVVWGMPGAVVRAGLADAVVPLDAVGRELIRRTSTRTGPLPNRGYARCPA